MSVVLDESDSVKELLNRMDAERGVYHQYQGESDDREWIFYVERRIQLGVHVDCAVEYFSHSESGAEAWIHAKGRPYGDEPQEFYVLSETIDQIENYGIRLIARYNHEGILIENFETGETGKGCAEIGVGN